MTEGARGRRLAAQLLAIFLVCGPAAVCGLWVCQADSLFGHAMVQFEQPCDQSLAMENSPVVDEMFIGWFGRSADEAGKVARRTLCCFSNAIRGAPGEETVRCLPDTHKWTSEIDSDLTAEFDCSQALMTGDGLLRHPAHTVMSHSDYVFLRGPFLASRGFDGASLSSHFGEAAPWFPRVERVRRLPSLRREPWLTDRGNGFIAKLSHSHPLRLPLKKGLGGEQIGQQFTFCCMSPSVVDGERVRLGDETIECIGGKKFWDFQVHFKAPEAIPSCSNPEWQDVKGPARPVRDWLSPNQYAELMEELSRPVPTESQLKEWNKVWRTAFLPMFSAVSAERKTYPKQRTPATSPLLDPGMSSCNDDAYHALDRDHESRKSNNPFEGRMVGLRPSNRLADGQPSEDKVVFFADEERLNDQIVVPFVGENSRRVFLKTALCFRGRHISVPDDEIRLRVVRDLVPGYTDMKYVYLSTIGNVRDYDAHSKSMDGGMDEGCGPLWLDVTKKDKQETTCREMVRDAATIARCIGEAQTRDAVRAEAMRYWRCDESAYGDGRVCHCNCGAWDPDCDAAPGQVLSYETAPALTDCPDATQRCGPIGCMANWRDVD